ncbi:hypothetical protein ACE1SV_55290 [Streptomyces sp. E-15]
MHGRGMACSRATAGQSVVGQSVGQPGGRSVGRRVRGEGSTRDDRYTGAARQRRPAGTAGTAARGRGTGPVVAGLRAVLHGPAVARLGDTMLPVALAAGLLAVPAIRDLVRADPGAPAR